MQVRDTVLTINVVEPNLVRAVGLLEKKLNTKLKGLVLVHSEYAEYGARPKDETGLFEEVVCNFNNPDEIQSALKPYIDRLLLASCRYEEAIQPFAKVIPFLPFIHTPSETALFWSTEKPSMRDRLHNYDSSLVPKYQYLEVQDLPKVTKLINDFEFPVIVKPSGLSKALLVSRCENMEELMTTLQHTFKIITNAYDREHYPGKPSVLVEEMMQGDMYSLDAYVSHDGKITCLPLVKVTTAHMVGLPGFYAYNSFLPAGLSNDEIQEANKVAIKSIKALSLSSTTAHIEMFHTADGWKIIEVAARIGGFRDVMYREVYGIEHYVNDLAVRAGHEPEVSDKPLGHAVAIKIFADEEGIIESIEGVVDARKIESIVYLGVHAEPGDFALFVSNGGDPIVDGILSNKDLDKLKTDLESVRRLVKIKTKP